MLTQNKKVTGVCYPLIDHGKQQHRLVTHRGRDKKKPQKYVHKLITYLIVNLSIY